MKTPPSLLDVLGASWIQDAPAVGVAFDRAVAAFGLGDGTLALAAGEWEGGPQLRPRAGGGLEVTPHEQPAPALTRLSVHEGACLALCADPAGGFVSGGDDGRMAHVAADGAVVELARFPGGRVHPVAAGRAGWSACAVGTQVHLVGEETRSLELQSELNALAFDFTGRRLAIAHDGGVSLWSIGAQAPRELTCPGRHRALQWSPDGRYVVSGLQDNALHGWRVQDGENFAMGGYTDQPRSLSFSADGRFLATSGGSQVVCWNFDPPGRDQAPTRCGIESRTPVTLVACHPIHALIAVGYDNGAVLLCQPGSADTLFIKGAGASAVSALAWSQDGTRLALGTQQGELGLISLPAALFRFGARATGASDHLTGSTRP
jgi:WD40 repeat protein